MKRLGLAAVGAAVLGLTACGGHSTTPDAASVVHRTPVSCHQQYRSWTHGDGKGVMGALNGVSVAAKRGNGPALTTALRHAKPAFARAAAHPIPACADPRGYWNVLLMHVNAASSGKGSVASARAAVKDVPNVMHALVVDVRQTAH
jgi:hypothetical protein